MDVNIDIIAKVGYIQTKLGKLSFMLSTNMSYVNAKCEYGH